MLGTLSIENQIENGLRSLQCSGRNFAAIASERGIRLSNSSFVRGMKDGFDRELGPRLLGLLKLMKATRDEFRDVPIDWSRRDRIAQLLSLVLLWQVSGEEGLTELQQNTHEAIRNEVR